MSAPSKFTPIREDGLSLWLIAYRLVAWTAGAHRAASVVSIALLGAAAAALTTLGEAAWFHWLTGAALSRVLRADLSLAVGWRPGQIVLLAGAAVVVAAVLRRQKGDTRRSAGEPGLA